LDEGGQVVQLSFPLLTPQNDIYLTHITRPGAISAWSEVLHSSTSGAQRRLL